MEITIETKLNYLIVFNVTITTHQFYIQVIYNLVTYLQN